MDVRPVAVAAPHRQRRAPVALARQRPVDVALQPLAHPAMLDVVGVPVDRVVVRHQLVPHGRRLHVPRALGVVDERRVTAPAVRIGVQVPLGAEDAPALGQRLDHAGVGLAHVEPGELAHPVVERAVRPDRVVDRDAVLGRHAEVVLAECGARVDHAGAVVQADEVAGEDRVTALPVVGQVVERRLVAHPQELLALHRGDGLVPLAEDAVGEGRSQDQLAAVLADANVVRAGIDHECRVRQQRPGHRRPGEERDALLAIDREADVERRVLDFVVSGRDLV